MTEFQEWMKEVDKLLGNSVGMTSDELPDYLYRDAFDDDLEPDEVYGDVLHQAHDCFGLFWEGD